jgi:ribosomal protein L22
MDNHKNELNQLRSGLIKHHKEEKQQLHLQNEQAHEELRRLLKNAAANIEKLKSIIQDHKSTIKLQQERIKKLD